MIQFLVIDECLEVKEAYLWPDDSEQQAFQFVRHTILNEMQPRTQRLGFNIAFDPDLEDGVTNAANFSALQEVVAGTYYADHFLVLKLREITGSFVEQLL